MIRLSRWHALGAFCAAACLAAAAAQGTPARIAPWQAILASNRVDRTSRADYFRAYYVDGVSDAAREAILARHLAARREAIAAAPQNSAFRADLGFALADVDHWDEARAVLEPLLEPGVRLDRLRLARVRFELANAAWQAGRTDEVRAHVRALVGMAWSHERPAFVEVARFLDRVWSSAGPVDFLDLPHAAELRPFPEARRVTNGAARLALATVALRHEGLAPDDAALAWLRAKLTRWGVRWAAAGAAEAVSFEVGVSPDAPVSGAEGYTLTVDSAGVRLIARDRRGAQWGIVSFLQCFDRTTRTVRMCELSDAPAAARRGCLTWWYPELIEYLLFNKINLCIVRFAPNVRHSPLERARDEAFARRARALGIEVYASLRDMTVDPLLPLSAPRTVRLHDAAAAYWARLGLGVYFALDDARFPLPAQDAAAAGTAARLDPPYLTRLYRTTKAQWPDFKMVFCPPFYWGPDGRAAYSEPREAYLRALGAALDPEIDVCWTGPRVKAAAMTPEKIAWFATRIGRAPTVFHNGNGIGQHNYCQFGADPTGFRALHGTNLFAHVRGFLQNANFLFEAPAVCSAADWCWNPQAHDPVRAVRRALDQLEGPGVYEALTEGIEALKTFDRFAYGRARGELLEDDPDELASALARGEAVWRRIKPRCANGGLFVQGFEKYGLAWARGLVATRRHPPKALVRQRAVALAGTALAEQEAGFSAKLGDVFHPASVLHGGRFVAGVRDATPGRPPCETKYLPPGAGLAGRFTCDPFPAEEPMALVVVARAFDGGAQGVPVQVWLNGKCVWCGVVGIVPRRFAPTSVTLPVLALARENRFEIRNAAPVESTGAVAIVHYVIVRRHGTR